MLKLIGTSSIASLGLSTTLFYNWGTDAAVKGDLMNSFLQGFQLYNIPIQGYDVPMNVVMLFTIISVFIIAFATSRAGKFLFHFLFLMSLASAFYGRRTTVVYGQREEYWNPNTNSIDYY